MNFIKTFLACLLAFVVANVILIIFVVMLMAGLTSAFTEGPASTQPNSVLVLDLKDGVTDSPDNAALYTSGLTGLKFNNSNSILDVLTAIENASYDNNIKGIYINITGGSVSMANVEEIRRALNNFRMDSGKFVIGYSDTYSQTGYYLTSVADKVFVNPQGSVEWQGLASQVMFYKGLFDKLGIKVEILRHGSFKAAVEPFMLEKMSPENRFQLNTVLESIWGMMVEEVGVSRTIDPGALEFYASELKLRNADTAVELGMVDAALYEDRVFGLMAKLIESPSASVEDELSQVLASGEAKFNKVNTISLSDYITVMNSRRASAGRADRIAIVYIDGDIVDGESASGTVGSATVADNLERAREDERVKGVVLRVNSPGGSALASDVMWREIELLRSQKPVVVSMGGYAASGGYYVSCPADMIITNKSTLTGSIGVFGMMLNMENTLKDKLGITVDVAKTNEHADMGSPFRPLASSEREYLMESIEDVYSAFVGHVADGRNMTASQADQLGGGRVWSGANAVDIGLADDIGGLWTAIEVCAAQAGVSDGYRIKEILDTPDVLTALLRGISSSSAETRVNEMGEAFIHYNKLMNMLEEQGVQARMPYTIEIR